MTPGFIGDSDNVVRYVGRMKILDDGRLDSSAFMLRPGETGLSVNLLAAGGGLDKAQQIAAVRQSIHRRVGRNSVFAELNVGEVKGQLADELPNLSFVSRPSLATSRFPQPDPMHCEILGLPTYEDDHALLIGDMLAQCVSRLHPAIPQPA